MITRWLLTGGSQRRKKSEIMYKRTRKKFGIQGRSKVLTKLLRFKLPRHPTGGQSTIR